MQGESDLLVKKEGALCTLVINRPGKRNLLTDDCLARMTDIFQELSFEEEVRVVIVRGAGEKAFSSGYDITALPADKHIIARESPLEKALASIRDFPYPVIAMINGDAFGGGCELAVGCDIRIAARHIRMGMPPARLGLVYPYPGYRRFLNVLGFSRTMEIFLTARLYGSRDCLEMGLVNHVVENHEIELFTREMALDMTRNAPLSLKGTKTALYKIAEYPKLAKTDEEKIQDLFLRSLESHDLEEGKKAFLEKRRPAFRGK